MNAQEARDIMRRNGWHPIVKISTAEYWIDGAGRYVILQWEGDTPEAVDLDWIHYARIEARRNGRKVLVEANDSKQRNL